MALIRVICFVAFGLVCSAAQAQDLATLVDQYKRNDLPFPPPAAVLCIHESGPYIVNGQPVKYRHLVFALDKPTDEKPMKCLVGIVEWTPSEGDKVTPVSPDDPKAKETEEVAFLDGFEFNVDFVMALQCEARGWNALANHLLKRSTSDYRGPASVAHVAWQYWRDQFTKAKNNRPQIVQRFKSLLKDERLGTAENKQLVADMESTLIQKSPTDRIERLIESLIDYSGGDEPIDKLTRAGFDAVPQLIKHLDDHRLTREIHPRINNWAPHHGRISEHVANLLEGLMLKERHFTVTKEAAAEWWKNAQKIGEEAYVRSKVLPEDKNAQWPSDGPLHVIQAKYPKYLPELYGLALKDYSKMYSDPIADALVASSLSRQDKIQALLQGARHRSLDHQRSALFHLLDLKYDGFVPLLVKTLDSLPVTPDGPYWHSVGAFATLVARSKSQGAWNALVRTTKRVDLGTKMEFMNVMNYGCGCCEDTPLAPRVAFLRGFLNDKTVRDVTTNREMYDGPCAGFYFDRIVVGDFAALQLASLLGVKADADPSWTATDWRHLQSRVDAKLAEYDAANKPMDSNKK